MELCDELREFKGYTEELIKSLEDEKYDKLEDILNKRSAIIESINDMKYSKEDFVKISNELDLLRLENKAHSLLAEKKDAVKEKIQSLFVNKKANKLYNTNIYRSAKIFSKKI